MTVDLSGFTGAPVFLRFALVAVAPSPAASPDTWWVDGIELATSPPVADLIEGVGGSSER